MQEEKEAQGIKGLKISSGYTEEGLFVLNLQLIFTPSAMGKIISVLARGMKALEEAKGNIIIPKMSPPKDLQ